MKSMHAKIVSSYLLVAVYIVGQHSLKDWKSNDFMELRDLETEIRVYEDLRRDHRKALEILNGEFNNLEDTRLTEG
ncbi:MAG: hypothetical protein AB7I27_06945 [Bacteriovoracaceae bacterium]